MTLIFLNYKYSPTRRISVNASIRPHSILLTYYVRFRVVVTRYDSLIYRYIHSNVHKHNHMQKDKYTCTSTHAYMHRRTYTFSCICIYTLEHINVYIHASIHWQPQCTHRHAKCSHIHPWFYPSTSTHAHRDTLLTRMHAWLDNHAFVHSYTISLLMHICMCSSIHIDHLALAHMYAFIHSYRITMLMHSSMHSSIHSYTITVLMHTTMHTTIHTHLHC